MQLTIRRMKLLVSTAEDKSMKKDTPTQRAGRISYAAIAWALGLPIPIIIIALIIGGCTKW
jgi:hypothetical protein